MPQDALNLKYCVEELQVFLAGGKIEKISMPMPDTLILQVFSAKKNHYLLISCNANYPRLHLTEKTYENPMTAPTLLMHMRKYLKGGIITGITQMPFERVIKISVDCRNELNFIEPRTLIIEIMGKYSNVILVNSDGKISEALRHIPLDINGRRTILPALSYPEIPKQNKLNALESEEICPILRGYTGGPLDKYIMGKVYGLALSSLSQAIYAALGQAEFSTLSEDQIQALTDALRKLYTTSPSPSLMQKEGAICDFAFIPYTAQGYEIQKCSTLNQAMDIYYNTRETGNIIAEKTKEIISALKSAQNKTEKRLVSFSEKLNDSQNLEDDKLKGELITANIYRIKTGMKEFEAENYYTENAERILIKLDEHKSPQLNAQSYYKKYNKKKKAYQMLIPLIEEAKRDIEYFASVEQSFKNIRTESDINELKEELEACGILKINKNIKRKKVKNEQFSVLKDGVKIIIGKNNLQNDAITKSARPEYLWLHTQKIHGSHVIIESASPSENIIEYAAGLAAYYSKASQSDKVPVDYALVKNVFKPKGSRPGFVNYTVYNTLYIKPLKP